MLHAVLLAAIVSLNPASPDAQTPVAIPTTAIQRCLETMDGAVYHGDPSDRQLMKANVGACEKGIAEIDAMRAPRPQQGPEKLFIIGRVLDRAATLSFMGLDDWATATREVKRANLYFRIAAGLRNQSAAYHEAAIANVVLTRLQLRTLRAERVAVSKLHAGAVAYHKL